MESVNVVNAVYLMESSTAFDLLWLHYNLMDTTYYQGKPHMLKWKLPTNGKTVQIFPSHKIQIIGKVSRDEVEAMYHTIVSELRQALDEPSLTVTRPKLCTMTLTAKLPFKPNLHRNVCNKQFSYEPELFPAAILSYWSPMKVILFPSGHINITGVKQESNVPAILTSLTSMFQP